MMKELDLFKDDYQIDSAPMVLFLDISNKYITFAS